MIHDLIILTSLVFLAFAGVAGYAIYKMKKQGREVKEWKKKYDKVLSAKISSEVRTGAIGEHLAPFLANWPFKDAKTFCPMGAPIDGINFDENGITIVEIKTGNARLSKQQKRIKHQVERGQIKFLEFRIAPDGVKIKKTSIKK